MRCKVKTGKLQLSTCSLKKKGGLSLEHGLTLAAETLAEFGGGKIEGVAIY